MKQSTLCRPFCPALPRAGAPVRKVLFLFFGGGGVPGKGRLARNLSMGFVWGAEEQTKAKPNICPAWKVYK